MSGRFGRLPPLNALRGFEAAARHGSFSRAAEELFMTQSAISHQVRALEEHFGQPLFKRIARAVELTDAGADFFETVTQALELLSRGVHRLESYTKPGTVIIAAPPSFASRWLGPRLADLKQAHPEVQPWIFSTEDFSDLEHSEIDLAFVFAESAVAGFHNDLLFDEAITPMATNSILEGRETTRLEDLLSHGQLIHDERREDWATWLRAAGIALDDVVSGPNFSDSGLALEAALRGDGIVLGSLVLAADDLGAGRLKRLSDLALPTASRYRLVYEDQNLKRPAVRIARDWIGSQAAEFRSALALLDPVFKGRP